MSKIKKVLVICLALFEAALLMGQESLNNLNTSWTIVIPGKVVSKPAVTSYGFTLITDGKLISSYSNEGKLLWEKALKRYREANLYALPDDFLLLISENNKKMTLLNPSGCQLWTKNLDQPVIDKPAYGWDGRFFLKNSSGIECYGISGIRKWSLSLPLLSKIPLQQLPDGSLVAFLEKTEEGKTKGLRISPFGQILEEITFAGQIVSSDSNKDGILLTFRDGSAGFFSLSQNSSQNKWVLQSSSQRSFDSAQIEKARFLLCPEKEDKLFYMLPGASSITFFDIDKDSGKINASFIIQNIKGLDLMHLSYRENGIFVCDNERGYFYSDQGLELWSAKFPDAQRYPWNYLIYNNENYLTFCSTNWTLNSYRVSQNVSKKSEKKAKNYNSYYTINTWDFEYLFKTKIDSPLASEERLTALRKGDYGTDEILYVSELMSACQVYKSELNTARKTNRQLSVFDLDTIGSQNIIKQLSLYSSSTFSSYQANYIIKINNKSLLLTLLRGLDDCAYDPDGKILASLEQLARKVNYKDEVTMEALCNAVYSICNFMGRPAFNTKGREILQNFLYPGFSSKTRDYARETLKKISALDL